jgi:hypothetical protein
MTIISRRCAGRLAVPVDHLGRLDPSGAEAAGPAFCLEAPGVDVHLARRGLRPAAPFAAVGFSTGNGGDSRISRPE